MKTRAHMNHGGYSSWESRCTFKGKEDPVERKFFPNRDILDPEGTMIEILAKDLIVREGNKCLIRNSNFWKS